MNSQEGQEQQKISSGDWAWPFWPIVPLYPYGKRRTIRQEVVKDRIWTFDQLQGIFYVVVPIRMTAVKLEGGGFLIYAPIAPTPECLRLLGELEKQHGEVRYIILPTVSGLEHKVFVGPFARHFPKATVFVTPHQWSYPLNLPLSWLGLPPKRTQVLPEDSSQAPFAHQFDYALLGPIDLGLGTFAEVAFFDRPSRSLLVTDSVLAVPEEPPAIAQLDPYPLLFHARDSARERIWDSKANRRQGWQRICLFALYFRPSALEVIGWGQAWQEARQGPDRSRKAYFGLFPFKWQDSWQKSFAALQGGGRLFVAPILQALILNRGSKATLDWAERVASWNFDRLLPCHFDCPLTANPLQFRQAFAFLSPELSPSETCQPLPPEDFTFIWELEQTLNKRGITPPADGHHAASQGKER